MKKLILKLMIPGLVIALFGIACKKGNEHGHLTNNTEIPKVTIGNQVWMAKNLDVSTYRNGDPILQVTDPSAWAGLTTGAWCWYNNDQATFTSYGKLYNWYAVKDPRGLAPNGWHVPAEAEWTTLFTYLGGEAVAGGKLKATGTTYWQSPNTGATNSSGFSGLPAGGRYNSGAFVAIGESAGWWSSSENNSGYAWAFELDYADGHINIADNVNKGFGVSVRCIKD